MEFCNSLEGGNPHCLTTRTILPGAPPWPCHPREGRDPPLALDSRLRGNDDLRVWERAVGVLRQPRMEFCDSLEGGNPHCLTPRTLLPGAPPGRVIPEKAEIHRWRWIPAFAGMTTSEHGNQSISNFAIVN
ncbi:hypothetical protein [Endozoicomonas sp. 8E]|uniref:hypothetical protein n=1 Tax=Endozoicomonas sp. 8E TaxID=3035692 RepID=UPI00293946A7|nr:hypothetical protein [Endozoicomonas sp. 8E]WOG29576.1 hypothetical protein P6910_07970 [Endozoicomonas sp. 8E]